MSLFSFFDPKKKGHFLFSQPLLLLPKINKKNKNTRASDIIAQWNALKIGLYDPPETLAAALGTTTAQARAIKGYVRHLALTLVGPGFEAFALGPKLAPASGGLIVRKTARQWIEGWTDPLLASIYGVGPASEVSAAFAWPSRDAPSRALGGRPISELKGGDHPQISRLTITTGEPLEELSSDGQGRTTYKEQLPTLLKSLDGSEFAVAPSSSSPVGVRVGGSVDGRIFHQKIKTDERGENLTLFDSTFGRPVVAHPVPSAVEIDEDQALEQASGTRFPKAGTAEAAGVYGNAGGIPARRYSLSNASASACVGRHTTWQVVNTPTSRPVCAARPAISAICSRPLSISVNVVNKQSAARAAKSRPGGENAAFSVIGRGD